MTQESHPSPPPSWDLPEPRGEDEADAIEIAADEFGVRHDYGSDVAELFSLTALLRKHGVPPTDAFAAASRLVAAETVAAELRSHMEVSLAEHFREWVESQQ